MVTLYRLFKHRRLSVYVVGVMMVLGTLMVGSVSRSETREFGEYTGEESLLDVLQSGLVLEDVRVMRCMSRSCEPPEHYVKVKPALNCFGGRLQVFEYFLISKKASLTNSRPFLVDLKIQHESPGGDFELTKKYGIRIWSKKRTLETLREDEGIIRDLQVLFGEEDLTDKRLGWEFQEQPVVYFTRTYLLHITLLKVKPRDEDDLKKELKAFQAQKRDEMVVGSKDRFRILQVSDLHFGQSKGKCTTKACGYDLKTTDFVKASISKEDIDFVVISGDLIDFDRSPHIQSALLKALNPILEAQIPFVFTFGESDTNEFNNPFFRSDKLRILGFLSSLHKCYNTIPLNPSQNAHIHGYTNHELKVMIQKEDSTTKKGIITVLDSEDHKIDSSQINYLYRSQHAAQDDNIFRLLFFHYPIPNFRPTGRFSLVGTYNERHKLNSKTDSTYRDDIIKCGYNVVAVGHEHQNDGCILSRDEKNDELSIWLCYSSVTGDSAETNLIENYDRMSRIFEMRFPSSQLITWKIKESDRKGFDHQSIATLKASDV